MSKIVRVKHRALENDDIDIAKHGYLWMHVGESAGSDYKDLAYYRSIASGAMWTWYGREIEDD